MEAVPNVADGDGATLLVNMKSQACSPFSSFCPHSQFNASLQACFSKLGSWQLMSFGPDRGVGRGEVGGGVGRAVVGSLVGLRVDGASVGDADDGSEVVGSAVIGAEVTGAGVVGSGVIGSEVVGSNVMGAGVVGAGVIGAGVSTIPASGEGATLNVGAPVVGTVIPKFRLNDAVDFGIVGAVDGGNVI